MACPGKWQHGLPTCRFISYRGYGFFLGMAYHGVTKLKIQAPEAHRLMTMPSNLKAGLTTAGCVPVGQLGAAHAVLTGAAGLSSSLETDKKKSTQKEKDPKRTGLLPVQKSTPRTTRAPTQQTSAISAPRAIDESSPGAPGGQRGPGQTPSPVPGAPGSWRPAWPGAKLRLFHATRVGWLGGWWGGWLAGWLVGLLLGCLIGWLLGCLVA